MRLAAEVESLVDKGSKIEGQLADATKELVKLHAQITDMKGYCTKKDLEISALNDKLGLYAGMSSGGERGPVHAVIMDVDGAEENMSYMKETVRVTRVLRVVMVRTID